MRHILVFALLLFANTAVADERWHQVASGLNSEKGFLVTEYIDIKTIRVNQGHRLAWIKEETRYMNGQQMTEYQQIEFDCAGKALYHIMDGKEAVNQIWKVITPDTVFESLEREACKLEASK